MYSCSNCGHTMSFPQDRCPSCGVLLRGVRCQSCNYVGGKNEFVVNGDCCPKCGSLVKTADESQSECFVATAVYGDPCCPQIDLLRRFRDVVLRPSCFGRWLIDVYYRRGPGWARIVRRHPPLQRWVRTVLDRIVSLLATRYRCVGPPDRPMVAGSRTAQVVREWEVTPGGKLTAAGSREQQLQTSSP